MRTALGLLLTALLSCALCAAAEFKSDEAKKASADFEVAIKAAKVKYGQDLAAAKAALDEKKAAATSPIEQEALEKESKLITDELVRLHEEVKGEAQAGEPGDLKTDAAKKAKVAFQAAVKAAEAKYLRGLVAAQRAVLPKKAASTENTVKEAFQQELDLIAEEIKQFRDEHTGAKPKPAAPDLVAQARTRLTLEGAAKLTPEGVVITGGGDQGNFLWVVQEVPVPFKAQFVVKTDSTNIRLRYGSIMFIFNWEMNPSDLASGGYPSGGGRLFPGQGKVPRNQWVTIDLVVTDTYVEVLVDGKTRAKVSDDFKGFKKRLGIQNSFDSVVTVKSLRLLPVN